MNNLSLREQPRRNRAELIPLQENASILKWLESTGRLRDRDDQEDFEERDEEIADMLVGEDNNYNNDDSDDSNNNSDMDD